MVDVDKKEMRTPEAKDIMAISVSKGVYISRSRNNIVVYVRTTPCCCLLFKKCLFIQLN